MLPRKFVSLCIGIALLASSARAETNPVRADTVLNSGDTYNFYFQKSPGTNQVEQGKTQTVEQGVSEPAPYAQSKTTFEQKDKKPIVDVSAGRMAIPKASETGITVGAELFPKNIVGFYVGAFSLSSLPGIDDTNYGRYYTDPETNLLSQNMITGNAIRGGDAAFTFNALVADWLKFSSMLGAIYFRQVKTVRTAVYWDPTHNASTGQFSRTDTETHVLPFMGLSLTAYFFNKHFGVNGTVKLPSNSKYITNSVNFVVSI